MKKAIADAVTVHVECKACGGTGVYSGFMERKGEAVICNKCAGRGGYSLTIDLFKVRKHKKGIEKIIIRAYGAADKIVSYEEFKGKIKPYSHG